MVRLLIIEPDYCPYIANFDNIESAVREVIPGTSQLTLPFDTAKQEFLFQFIVYLYRISDDVGFAVFQHFYHTWNIFSYRQIQYQFPACCEIFY